MNHTVTHEFGTNRVIPTNEQDQESFLRKIELWVNAMSMSRRPTKNTDSKYSTFIEANLLDDVVGPEISRTLRR